jgi:hypothetical protein
MGEKEVIRFTTNLFLQETQKVARNYFWSSTIADSNFYHVFLLTIRELQK